MQKWKKLFVALCVGVSMTSCYRMPTDDDYSVIPMTNSPDLQRQESSLTPSVGY